MQNAVVNINGQLHGPLKDFDEAKVSVFDRGFLYGDSLYEVVRTYDGVPFALDEHLERLGESARLAYLTPAQDIQSIKRETLRTIGAFLEKSGNKREEAYCRVILTRGVGKIGYHPSTLSSPSQLIILCVPFQEFTPEQWNQGMRLAVVQRIRNDARALNPAMKSGNLLNNILAYLEALEAGADDALLCNAEGHVTEGTSFNIFYLKGRIAVTPPLDIGILSGITRDLVMSCVRELGLELREARFSKERLYEADEVFLTSSLKEVFPVTRIDHVRIHGGKPGTVTRQIAEAYSRKLPKRANA